MCPGSIGLWLVLVSPFALSGIKLDLDHSQWHYMLHDCRWFTHFLFWSWNIIWLQLMYLEEWAIIEKDHSNSLLGSTESLRASTLRLPIVCGAMVGIRLCKFFIHFYVHNLNLCSILLLFRRIFKTWRTLCAQDLMYCKQWHPQYALWCQR